MSNLDEAIVEAQQIADIKDTITALEGYNFFLHQVSKSRLRSTKERKNASNDIKVIDRLIKKYKEILEEYLKW